MADIQSQQLLVIRSYYNYCHSIGPITPIDFGNLKLFEQTADLIAGWNDTCSSATLNVLKRQNIPILVRVGLIGGIHSLDSDNIQQTISKIAINTNMKFK